MAKIGNLIQPDLAKFETALNSASNDRSRFETLVTEQQVSGVLQSQKIILDNDMRAALMQYFYEQKDSNGKVTTTKLLQACGV